MQTLFIFSQVFAIIREVDNPQLFTLEFVRGTTKKFMSTDRYIKGNESYVLSYGMYYFNV